MVLYSYFALSFMFKPRHATASAVGARIFQDFSGYLPRLQGAKYQTTLFSLENIDKYGQIRPDCVTHPCHSLGSVWHNVPNTP